MSGYDFNLLERRRCDVCGKSWLRHFQAEPCSHTPGEHGRAAGQAIVAAMARARAEATTANAVGTSASECTQPSNKGLTQ